MELRFSANRFRVRLTDEASGVRVADDRLPDGELSQVRLASDDEGGELRSCEGDVDTSAIGDEGVRAVLRPRREDDDALPFLRLAPVYCADDVGELLLEEAHRLLLIEAQDGDVTRGHDLGQLRSHVESFLFFGNVEP